MLVWKSLNISAVQLRNTTALHFLWTIIQRWRKMKGIGDVLGRQYKADVYTVQGGCVRYTVQGRCVGYTVQGRCVRYTVQGRCVRYTVQGRCVIVTFFSCTKEFFNFSHRTLTITATQ